MRSDGNNSEGGEVREAGGRKPYRLVIFDMDGTLTEALLDFGRIRRDIGLPSEGGILEHIAQMEGRERDRANAILDRHELEAADRCALHEGAEELLRELRRRGIRTALLTRNSKECARRIVERHGLELDYVATREDEPHKPHPDSILNIVREMGISPEQTLMVGDYLYDLEAARAAGTDSALLRVDGAGGAAREWPAFASLATYRIRRLREIVDIVDGAKA